METLEGGGRARAEQKHGAGDKHGDELGQEVAGKRPKWWMASRAERDEGMKVGSMDPQTTGRAPGQRQQRPGSKEKANGASQSE